LWLETPPDPPACPLSSSLVAALAYPRSLPQWVFTFAGEKYYVIPSGWWRLWCGYTKYDAGKREDDGMEICSEAPGAIPNRELSAPNAPDELRPGLVEDQDYKILPERAYKQLESYYGADSPAFCRNAIDTGKTFGQSNVIVELYPVRSRIRLVEQNGYPAESYSDTLLSRQLRISDVEDLIMKEAGGLGLPKGTFARTCRVWYKKAVDEPGAGDDKDVNSDGFVVVDEHTNGHDVPNGEQSDQETEDAEEEQLSYVLFEKSAGVGTRLLDLIDAGPVRLDILVEFRDSTTAPWPRAAVLNAWKLRLKAGDEIDAKDTDGKWFEAVVIRRTEKGGDVADELNVHYMGWGEKWNEDFPLDSEEHLARISKRNTKVEYWRNFSVGDQVELKDWMQPKRATWYQGTVKEIREESETLPTRKDGKLIEPLPESEKDLDGKRLLIGASVKESNSHLRWVAAKGESICQFGTHLQSKAKEASTPKNSYSSYSGYSYGFNYSDSGVRGKPPIAGAVGLKNLGNTCFMNSMLQCISHTPQLTGFFLNGGWRDDVNKSNPLGMQGKLATVYADFLKDVWGGNHTVVAPTTLKRTVGTFNPTFAGYAQQDSQEFMSFLLDGLHEDLNRNHEKPYTEQVESKGRPDEEVAKEQWRRHLLRNDSVVVDNCHGLLRSHLTCCKCGYNSITFDPFLSLSLPLPVNNTRRVDLVVMPAALSENPYRMTVDMQTNACLGDVKRWIAEQTGVDQERLVVTSTWNHKMLKNLRDKHPLSEVRDSDDIFVHELSEPPVDPEASAAEGEEDDEAAERMDLANTTANEVSGAATNGVEKEKRKNNWGLQIFGRKKNKDGLKGSGVGERSHEGYGEDQFIDLLPMVPKTGYYSKSYEIVDTPRRVFLPPDATNAYLYEKAREINQRIVKSPLPQLSEAEGEEPREEGSDPVFRLVYAGSYMYSNPRDHEPVQDSDEPFVKKKDGKKGIVGIIYHNPRYLDEQAIRSGIVDHSSYTEYDRHSRQERESISLRECFEQLLVREQLNETDMWYCSRCKEHVRAFKKFDLWSLPNILILHLKRFHYLPGTYFVHRQKLEELVDFPLEALDMSGLVLGAVPEGTDLTYDLYAVSEHSGGLGGGHYTAVARNMEDLPDASGEWFAFNDSGVSRSDPRRVVTPRAYVLFYKRRGPNVRWGGMQPLAEELSS